jgi:hypothetical protein
MDEYEENLEVSRKGSLKDTESEWNGNFQVTFFCFIKIKPRKKDERYSCQNIRKTKMMI